MWGWEEEPGGEARSGVLGLEALGRVASAGGAERTAPSLAGQPHVQGKWSPQTGAGCCVHLDFSTPLFWIPSVQSWQRWLEPESFPIYF